MKTNTAPKPDFMDEVDDEMDKGGDQVYGADMEDGEDNEPDDAQREDIVLAAKHVAKAGGFNPPDMDRFADALRSFCKACDDDDVAPPADIGEK